jgi:hypothetical protein
MMFVLSFYRSTCYNTTRMDTGYNSLQFTIGPLRYLFVPHGRAAADWLSFLQRHLESTSFSGPPHRIVHLLDGLVFGHTEDELAALDIGLLPAILIKELPKDTPCAGWSWDSDVAGHVVIWHEETPHAIFMIRGFATIYRSPYQLPWQIIQEDILARKGGVLHGGLAVCHGKGYLFTAPPGGGKSTALARLPSPWRVLADDGVLVWPADNGLFRASPLPTWSVILGVNGTIPAIGRWRVGESIDVAGVFLLKKSERDKVRSLPPVEMAQQLYQPFSEHPSWVPATRKGVSQEMFRISCALARAVSGWELELTIDGAFWEVVREAVTE